MLGIIVRILDALFVIQKDYGKMENWKINLVQFKEYARDVIE
jgi:hypothetical protein